MFDMSVNQCEIRLWRKLQLVAQLTGDGVAATVGCFTTYAAWLAAATRVPFLAAARGNTYPQQSFYRDGRILVSLMGTRLLWPAQLATSTFSLLFGAVPVPGAVPAPRAVPVLTRLGPLRSQGRFGPSGSISLFNGCSSQGRLGPYPTVIGAAPVPGAVPVPRAVPVRTRLGPLRSWGRFGP